MRGRRATTRAGWLARCTWDGLGVGAGVGFELWVFHAARGVAPPPRPPMGCFSGPSTARRPSTRPYPRLLTMPVAIPGARGSCEALRALTAPAAPQCSPQLPQLPRLPEAPKRPRPPQKPLTLLGAGTPSRSFPAAAICHSAICQRPSPARH